MALGQRRPAAVYMQPFPDPPEDRHLDEDRHPDSVRHGEEEFPVSAVTPERTFGPLRGLLIGCALSIPIWALIYLLLR